MAKPLSDQIKAALAPDARATTVASLIFDIRRAVGEAASVRDQHHAIAVSAQSDDDAAEAAADAEMKASRKHTRLEAQLAEVEARHVALLREAEQKRQQIERDAILAERDQLVADLQDRWQTLAEEMVSLIERVVVNDPKCRAHRITGPEELARGMVGVDASYRRIIDLDIPPLEFAKPLLRQRNMHWASGAWS